MSKKQEHNESQLCEKLWEKYEPRIRRICAYKLTSCPDEVDEVVSQTYLALCIKLNEGTIQNPKAWA